MALGEKKQSKNFSEQTKCETIYHWQNLQHKSKREVLKGSQVEKPSGNWKLASVQSSEGHQEQWAWREMFLILNGFPKVNRQAKHAVQWRVLARHTPNPGFSPQHAHQLIKAKQIAKAKVTHNISLGSNKTFYFRAAEMAQGLRALAATPEDPSLVSSIHVRWLTTSVTPPPEDLASLVTLGTYTHVPTYKHTHLHRFFNF